MKRSIVYGICGILVLLIGGCSGTVKRPSAKEYYEKANEAYTTDDYVTATESYQELLDQYPLNPYAEEGQLKIAYAHYLNKKYAEALAAFSDFERSYPTSSHLAFVQYYRGMAYLEQMRSIDRDQSVAEKANDFFKVVLDRYRDSPFAPLAEEKSRYCRESIAARELYVIDFQIKRLAMMAARARLRVLIEEYPETDSTVFALERLQNLMEQEGKKDIATLAAQALEARKAAIPPPHPLSTKETKAGDPAKPVVTELPSPSLDPLLTLVTALKKLEQEDRVLVAHPPGSEQSVKPDAALTGEDKKILDQSRQKGKEAE
jgi:outer membrane protein assembly factor BamD